jgi:2-polyprenyl-3-methyl-5-hydroxy-6-metoxy-1,4-benzoquinol methylase
VNTAVVSQRAGPAQCIACEAPGPSWLFSKQSRDIWRCTSCGLEMQHPIPSLDALSSLYEKEYAQGFGVDYLKEADLNALRARLRYRQLAPACKAGRWLDVGCASGEFVAAARAGGQDAQGIDLSTIAVARGVERGLPLRAMRLEELDSHERFDTITGFDVIEHVTDPALLLASIRDRLVPGGTVALTTPNLASWTRRVLGRKWLFYLPDIHLFYFDPRSFAKLLKRSGLELVRVSTCYKHVTLAGIADELRLHPSALFRLGERVLRATPRALRERAIALNLGEMLVVARRPV